MPELAEPKNGAQDPVHLPETAGSPDWTPNPRQSDQIVAVSKVMSISPTSAPATGHKQSVAGRATLRLNDDWCANSGKRRDVIPRSGLGPGSTDKALPMPITPLPWPHYSKSAVSGRAGISRRICADIGATAVLAHRAGGDEDVTRILKRHLSPEIHPLAVTG